MRDAKLLLSRVCLPAASFPCATCLSPRRGEVSRSDGEGPRDFIFFPSQARSRQLSPRCLAGRAKRWGRPSCGGFWLPIRRSCPSAHTGTEGVPAAGPTIGRSPRVLPPRKRLLCLPLCDKVMIDPKKSCRPSVSSSPFILLHLLRRSFRPSPAVPCAFGS